MAIKKTISKVKSAIKKATYDKSKMVFEQRQRDFLAEYAEISQKYGVVIVPGMTLSDAESAKMHDSPVPQDVPVPEAPQEEVTQP
jgi:hypothetical protein